jgi:hypothetical protein
LVFRDEGRDRQRGNAGNYVSMVGLGCLLECILIAASGEGFSSEVDFCFNDHDLLKPWLAITFKTDQAKPDDLLSGLRLRCSDRREYEGGELSHLVFRQVAADVERFSNCRIYFIDAVEKKLLAYLLRCETFLWADKYILPEMLSWVRWSRQEVLQTRDGMPWQSLGVNFLTSRLMMAVAKSKRFRQFARKSGGPLKALQKTLEAQIRSSAALGCITARDTRHATIFQLGRLFLRAWVRLNMAGFGVQVMANPAIHAFQSAIGIIPDDYPDESKQIFVEGKSILVEAFDIPRGEFPFWMFRTGKSAPLPEKMKTLRLPLSEVVRSSKTVSTELH